MSPRLVGARRFAARWAPSIQAAGVLAFAATVAAVELGWSHEEPPFFPRAFAHVRMIAASAVLIAPLLALAGPGRWRWRPAMWVIAAAITGGFVFFIARAHWLTEWVFDFPLRPWSVALALATLANVALIARSLADPTELARVRMLAMGITGLACVGALWAVTPLVDDVGWANLTPFRTFAPFGEWFAAPTRASFFGAAAACGWLAAIRSRSYVLAAFSSWLSARASVQTIEVSIDTSWDDPRYRVVLSYLNLERAAIASDVIEATALALVALVVGRLAWRAIHAGSIGRRARALSAVCAPSAVALALLATAAFEWPHPALPDAPWREVEGLELGALHENAPGGADGDGTTVVVEHDGTTTVFTSGHRRRLAPRELVARSSRAPITVVFDRRATLGDLRRFVARTRPSAVFDIAGTASIERSSERARRRFFYADYESRMLRAITAHRIEPRQLDELRQSECIREVSWPLHGAPRISSCAPRRTCIGPQSYLLIGAGADDRSLFEVLRALPREDDAELLVAVSVDRTFLPASRYPLVEREPDDLDVRAPLAFLLVVLCIPTFFIIREWRTYARARRRGSRELVDRRRNARVLPCWAEARDVTAVVLDASQPSYRDSPRVMIALAGSARAALAKRLDAIARFATPRLGAGVCFTLAVVGLLWLLYEVV